MIVGAINFEMVLSTLKAKLIYVYILLSLYNLKEMYSSTSTSVVAVIIVKSLMK